MNRSMSTFSLQATPLMIAADATANDLSIDVACFTDVISDLAFIGTNDPDDQENLFHAIKYLATLASALATELQRRTADASRTSTA